MYAKYQYVSGATQANILADLTAILTGETDKNNLSAGCDKTNTTITSTIAAGWTLHDGSSGTNKKVIKAPYSGNASKYKYAEINLYSTTGFTAQIYEDFNATTHTGTNASGQSQTTYLQRLLLTSNDNKIHVWATPRMIALFSELGSGLVGDDSYSGATIITEMKPLPPWNNDTDYPYPSFGIGSSYSYYSAARYFYVPRALKNTNSDATGANAGFKIASIGACSDGFSTAANFPNGVNAKVYDGGVLKVPRFPMFAIYPENFTMPIGDISACSDIWLAPYNLLTLFDLVTVGANEYLAIPASQTTIKYLIRKA